MHSSKHSDGNTRGLYLFSALQIVVAWALAEMHRHCWTLGALPRLAGAFTLAERSDVTRLNRVRLTITRHMFISTVHVANIFLGVLLLQYRPFFTALCPRRKPSKPWEGGMISYHNDAILLPFRSAQKYTSTSQLSQS
ncbi:hypothetical protein BKA70DRAFT_39803 [Coprinopsis sp. MPI-PUGE-AT-0042]|nr:hypothetical protein BKA70DRAFT_39803 [Coprinopsis sp. MPI-PUGE-AT-0042]